MTTIRTFARKYDADNLEAAGVIMREIARYGGDDALLVQWARLVISGSVAEHGAKRRPQRNLISANAFEVGVTQRGMMISLLPDVAQHLSEPRRRVTRQLPDVRPTRNTPGGSGNSYGPSRGRWWAI